jgi:hypothetical protein
MEHSQLVLFERLFVGRRDDFARQRPDGGYFRVGRALTSADLRAHLAGRVTLGSYVIDERGCCHSAVFDADLPDGLCLLRDVQARLARQGIPSYLERSRRGGHLWVFLTAPVPASQVRAWLLPFCPPGVEFYPKQAEGAGYGSLIRLPLGVHLRSGKRYPFVEWNERGLVVVASTVAATLAWLATVARAAVPACQPATSRASNPQETSFSSPAPPLRSLVPATIRAWCAAQDPYQLIGSYVDLNRQGIGCCPFGWHHADGRDTRASFKVYQPGTPGGYCWYCYVWQQGGSVFDFLRYWYGLSARELWHQIQRKERRIR